MKKTKILISMAVLVLASLACGQSSSGDPTDLPAAANPPAAATDAPAEPTAAPEPTAETQPEPTEEGLTPGDSIRQWASAAAASSSYDEPDWGPGQATGAPDSPDCNDWHTAWAAQYTDEVDWLEVSYAEAVFPTEIHVHQNFSPGQISLVEVRDLDGAYHQVYSAVPETTDCPAVLTVPVDLDFPVVSVRITVDQTVLPELWNEIDAVELVGLSTGMAVDYTPGAPVADIPVGDPPENLVGRIGRDSQNDHILNAPGGMDTALHPDYGEVILVADQINGVLMFDSSGELVETWEIDGLTTASDLKVAPNGDVYVVNWNSEQVFVLSGGELLFTFGEAGPGPGQFGEDSPEAVAIAADGTVYVLDRNFEDNGDDFYRVQSFTPAGSYLGEFRIEEEVFSANAMEFGPDGNLYILGFIGGPILKYSPDGTLLDTIGSDALFGTGPRYIDFDDFGTIYVSVWSDDAGVIVLDPDGGFVTQLGFGWEDGDSVPPPGYHHQPSGVAALGDGAYVYVVEWGSGYAHITIYENLP